MISVTKVIAMDETDDRPSTFWITNLRNKFIGNVAAGCDSSGYGGLFGSETIWCSLFNF